MYLVDTNVLSEARRGTTEARNWLRSVDPATIYLSVITLGEIMKGIALKMQADPRAAASLTAWLEQLRHERKRSGAEFAVCATILFLQRLEHGRKIGGRLAGPQVQRDELVALAGIERREILRELRLVLGKLCALVGNVPPEVPDGGPRRDARR